MSSRHRISLGLRTVTKFFFQITLGVNPKKQKRDPAHTSGFSFSCILVFVTYHKERDNGSIHERVFRTPFPLAGRLLILGSLCANKGTHHSRPAHACRVPIVRILWSLHARLGRERPSLGSDHAARFFVGRLAVPLVRGGDPPLIELSHHWPCARHDLAE